MNLIKPVLVSALFLGSSLPATPSWSYDAEAECVWVADCTTTEEGKETEDWLQQDRWCQEFARKNSIREWKHEGGCIRGAKNDGSGINPQTGEYTKISGGYCSWTISANGKRDAKYIPVLTVNPARTAPKKCF